MNVNKKIARIAGMFYLAATIAGLVSIGLTESTVGASDYLVKVSENESQILLGAFFELMMAVAVAGIAVTVYPVLRQHNASIAIGYIGARIVEGVIFLLDVVMLLTLLTLSREFVDAGGQDTSYFQTLGELLLAARDWAGHVALDVAVFPVGALIFNYLLYQAKLVPAWLSGWGFLGAILYWSASVLVMFDVIEPLSTVHIILQAPLGIQEIIFAVWLIVKGFTILPGENT